MKFLASLFAIVLVALPLQAGTLNWDNVVTQFYDSSGGTPPDATWYVGLFSTGSDGFVDEWVYTTGPAVDDILLDFTDQMYSGMLSETYNFTGTYEVYVRLFNNADPFAARAYVDGATGETTFVLDGTGTGDYGAGGSASDGSDWVSIPEPSSMALMGLGLIVVSLRKRFSK